MKTKNKKGSGSKASAATEEKQAAVANPRLVAAIRVSDDAAGAYKSSLITIATICQEEQLTKGEVVASMMEARGCTKQTAESQYSRVQGLLKNPEVLEQLKNGEIDLKTARVATTKKQTNPSPEKKKESIEKRISKSLQNLVIACKEGGMDRASILVAVKSACKKAGIV